MLAECALTFHSLLDSEFSLLSTVVRETATELVPMVSCELCYALYRRWPLIS